MSHNNISFWVKSLPEHTAFNANAQTFDAQVHQHFDVVIIGAGFTGLWLAYYLNQAQPHWNIAIFEAQQVAYGASGRNGGWLSPHMPGIVSKMLKAGISQENIVFFQQQVTATIAEVRQVCQKENIDCDLHEGGLLTIAMNPAQATRLHKLKQHDHQFGYPQDEIEYLNQTQAQTHLNSNNVKAALLFKHGARIQPAKLAFGLRDCLRTRGVKIFENSPVTAFGKQHVQVQGQKVSANYVVSCTEGYSDALLKNRKIIPVNSSIITTEVLPEAFWQRFGWTQKYLLNDQSHQFFYAQRTRDDRIVFGGRGAPYQFNSVDAGHGHLDNATIAQLQHKLAAVFPEYPIAIAHAWKGSLGVTRDWCASVSLSPNTQVGHVYGFAGHGVAGTNLAARHMATKVLQQQSELERLPWNNFQNPTWETEPFRWIGIHSMYRMLGWADQIEYRKQQPQTTALASIAYKICGLN
ncbi:MULTISPECIES: NAD(P)/FAD-dependent oxidoreductase [Vitreoscilla]|uniref:FAD-binding oxidoreductase n=1 Tax=Vitreoscilla stercoraria TaxID=61 RepID=A0ABY4E884_VITST|nr:MULTISPECIES: FAD-dependent oxidoreductase [Vitreoscilla]UOO91558.1 FAD-binding oxidoreductase [Vitreoscilla stercoraria]